MSTTQGRPVDDKRLDQWLHELETTEEKQGQGRLGHTDIGFCCLGIGCKVAGVKFDPSDPLSAHFIHWLGLRSRMGRPVDPDELTSASNYGNILIKNADLSMLPPEKLEALDCGGSFDVDVTVAELNDKGECTFKEIAAVVRANRTKLVAH